MAFEISSATQAKQFIEYLEAFSFANQITQSIREESISLIYSAIFNSRKLEIDAKFYDGEIKMKVVWRPIRGAAYIRDTEFDEMFKTIKGAITGVSSYDHLQQAMSFVVYDFEDLNMLVDLLTEGFKF
jgi:hypothetical protein